MKLKLFRIFKKGVENVVSATVDKDKLIQEEKWRKFFGGTYYLITDGDYRFWSTSFCCCSLSWIEKTESH